jgi:hypothetical protein
MADGRTEVKVTATRADGKSAEFSWFFTVGKTTYQLYFGQLHGHTQYSDGAGSLDSALSYIKNLPDSANVQFVAFTDHSNYFDSKNAPNVEAALYDTSLVKDSDANHSWKTYKDTIAQFNEDNAGSMVAIGGFEMTWSGGPGHINTFNTPGIVSRNNSTLNNKTDDAGMKAYYALLSQTEGANSISQFNHPGTTFGNFKDFSYWNPVIDSRMYMVEVGNGEGQIGAGGYYPSYEQYIMALDKGWHLAPTNNQDNHQGKWGNANDARDVILTDNFTEEGIYDAIRALRMYATEDKNLELGYTVNGLMMGSRIETVPGKLDIEVSVYDPDRTDSIAKVEVVVNSGKVAHVWDDPAEFKSGTLSVTLAPEYSYYFIRVTQKDGDLAVTAPVWVGESLKLGISNLVCGTATPVTDEELTLTTTLFNSESAEATVTSLIYSIGGKVIGTDTAGYTIAAGSTLDIPFKWTPDQARVATVLVTAVVNQNNKDYTFTKTISLDVLDASKLVYIGIDASHYNEYVNGNYKDSMGNFGNLAAEYSVRTVQLNTSADLIAACSNPKYKAMVLTAPSRRSPEAQADPKTYSQEELAALTAFNDAGGTVILAGWSDNYENYEVIQNNPNTKHMAETQNDVLQALGSSLRISDDATYDDVRSAADGVDKWRLYFSDYNMDNFLTDGVIVDTNHPYDKMYTERFSHYGGASIYAVDANGNPASALPATVSPVVYGHASTYSVDVDKDGRGGAGIPKYTYAENDPRLLIMATEQLEGKGMVIVSGAAFLSNFEVQSDLDNTLEKNYSNYRICENLINYLNPPKISTIAEVHADPDEGIKYTVEGIVTSNASGYDKNTAFFDCIYIQDETGGINCFPVAGGDTYYAFAAASSQFDTGLPLDEIVMEYITTVLGGVVGQEYAEPDGRMTVILPPDEDDGKITIGGLDANIWMTKYGNVYTDCKAEKFMGDMGFNWGDLVTVEFLGKTLTLPVIPTYSYVDSGKPAIIVEKGEDGNPTGYVSMAINMGNFAETYELAVKHTDEDKNWYWTAWEGVTYPVEVTFTMAEKDGYRAEYILHELQRTNNRADYPDLTDAEFANFRNVATTGMGKNLLYRGSSPINPELGRSGYADAALKKAGVTVIMNLADSEADAKAYEGFADTYYAGQKVIYLNLGVDFTAPEFQAGLADGLRFFAANKGVYYVHCTEGKDRAGFVNALLECLMGAAFNEVVEDYMTTYYNYYGVEPGTDKYTAIAESNIIKTLQTAFGVEDLSKADLQQGAKDYMKAIGLTDAEITSLMTNLGYKAPATGDTGVVLYVGLAVLALTGGVFVARRKELF